MRPKCDDNRVCEAVNFTSAVECLDGINSICGNDKFWIIFGSGNEDSISEPMNFGIRRIGKARLQNYGCT